MKISVESSQPVEQYYLKNLHDEQIEFELDNEFGLAEGWYNLHIEYTGTHIDISDILINDWSIKHLIYTGFFTDHESGKRFQPANAVWAPGHYTIWIHTQLGHMLQTHLETIRGGDYGTDLSENYLYTVDKSVMLGNDWPEEIRSYFAQASGPRWWHKQSKRLPYELCEVSLESVDKQKLVADLPLDCPVKLDYDILGRGDKQGRMPGIAIRKNSVYPFIEIDSLQGTELKKLCKLLGYTRILNVTLQTQHPDVAFDIHIDDHYKRDCREYIEGPVVFLWDLADNTQGHYFKLGASGLVPLGDGVFFNQMYHSHGSFNSGTEDRPLLIIHGDRDKKYE